MSGLPFYQVILLGSIDVRRTAMKRALSERLVELGLEEEAIALIDEANAATRDPRLPLMAIFFGEASVAADSSLVRELISESVVIAPVVSSPDQVQSEIPPQLRGVNALELRSDGHGLDRLVSLVLETFRLLRTERRLFISYRRNDAYPFAERLYNALDARGFDVFLDVRSIPPAVDFQSELWHRMSDADVVVLVDTPSFRASRWTTAELARANATNIQILHLLWPGQKEDSSSSFSHFMNLKRSDFRWYAPRKGQHVTEATLSRICSAAEQLRARAIAARYRYLVDNFCDAARDLGMVPTVQAERWIAIPLSHGRILAAVPAVGVPTSDRLNTIFDAVSDPSAKTRELWVVYDNRGLLSTWLAHLDWLDTHLPIQAVRMSRAPDRLKALS